MRVLGIDCGSRVTGYGVIDTDGADCVFVRCGAIRSKASDSLADKLKCIHDGLFQIIRELRPEAAAEKPQVQQMVRALLKLNALPEPYDASDALAVAICHIHSHRFNKSLATHP